MDHIAGIARTKLVFGLGSPRRLRRAFAVAVLTAITGCKDAIRSGGQRASGAPTGGARAGATAIQGLVWRGPWEPAMLYAAGDAVEYSGSSYVAVAPSAGVAPPGDVWTLLAAQGAVGSVGPAGRDGPAGATGPMGPKGLVWRGSWSGAAQYSADDAIEHHGASYLAVAPSMGVPPPSPEWSLLAAQGAVGAAGPQGAAGVQGPAGPRGPKGLVWRGSWSGALTYDVDDAVEYQGASYIAVAPSTAAIPPSIEWALLAAQGATGAPGPQGVPGIRGPEGPQGAPGPAGPTGIAHVLAPLQLDPASQTLWGIPADTLQAGYVTTGAQAFGGVKSADGFVAKDILGCADVRAFGAVGDGVVDDTSAIQAALSAVGSAGGGRVCLPAGRFLVTNTLLVPSNTHVAGAGRRATVLVSPPGDYPGRVVEGVPVFATLAMAAVANASVRGLTVDHTSGRSANGIVVVAGAAGAGTRSRNCLVADCEVLFSSSPGHAYAIWNLVSDGTKFIRNHVDGGVLINDPGAAEGIETYGGDDVLIQGNTVRNVSGNGIYVTTDGLSATTRDVRVIANYVEGSHRGITVLVGSAVDGAIVLGNEVVQSWENGLMLTAGAGAVASSIQFRNNVVRSSGCGIALYGDPAAVPRSVVVAGNVVKGTTTSNCAAIQSSYFSHSAYEDNDVEDAAERGIFVDHADDVILARNRITGTAANAVFLAAVSHARVSGNTMRDYDRATAGSAGLWVESCNEVAIADNAFWQPNVTAYPIRVPNGDKIAIGANIVQMTFTGDPVFRSDSTNSNRGVITLSPTDASEGQITIRTSVVHRDSLLLIQQRYVSGVANLPFSVERGGGFFVIHFSGASGGETFEWVVL